MGLSSTKPSRTALILTGCLGLTMALSCGGVSVDTTGTESTTTTGGTGGTSHSGATGPGGTADGGTGNGGVGLGGNGGSGGVGTGGSGGATAATDTIAWCARWGDSDEQEALAVAVDATGKVLVAGGFEGVLDFGAAGTLDSNGRGAFVVALDPNGVPLWARSFTGGFNDEARAVAVDSTGNVIVAGKHGLGCDLGTGPIDHHGVFLVVLSPVGDLLLVKSYGALGGNSINALTALPGDEIGLAGGLHNTLDFGGGPLQSAGNLDVLTVHLDVAGNQVWAASWGAGGPSQQEALSLSRQSTGDLLIAGYTTSPFDIAGQNISQPVFWAKIAADGTPLSAAGMGDTGPSGGLRAVTMKDDNVLLVGSMDGPLDCGGGSLPGEGVFAASVDAQGNHRFSHRYGKSDSFSFAPSLASSLAGHAIFGGWVYGDFEFGGTTYSTPSYRGFLAELDPDGNPLRFRLFEGGWTRSEALAVGPADEVLLAGSLGGKLVADGLELQSAGSKDVLVCKLVP